MASGRAVHGPGRPRAGPENPGPPALRAETGLMIFYLRFLCALCAGRWKCTWDCITVCACDLWTLYDSNFYARCQQVIKIQLALLSLYSVVCTSR